MPADNNMERHLRAPMPRLASEVRGKVQARDRYRLATDDPMNAAVPVGVVVASTPTTSCRGSAAIMCVAPDLGSSVATDEARTRLPAPQPAPERTLERAKSRRECPAFLGGSAGSSRGLSVGYSVEGVAQHLLAQRECDRDALQARLQFACFFEQVRNARTCVVPR